MCSSKRQRFVPGALRSQIPIGAAMNRGAAAGAQTARITGRLVWKRAADDRYPRLDDARLFSARSTRASCRAAPGDRSRSRRWRRRWGSRCSSSRGGPPSPTSRTAMSTRASRKSTKATAVAHSKKVGSASSAPAATSAAAGAAAPDRRVAQLPRRHFPSIDDEPFFEAGQVWRRVAGAAVSGGAQRRARPSP